jgi:hypothetical protein
LKYHPTEFKIIFGIENIYGIVNLSNIVWGSINVKDFIPIKVNAPHIDSTTLVISSATINMDNKVSMVGTNMDILV